jgi:CheY-like chemotaxis protein
MAAPLTDVEAGHAPVNILLVDDQPSRLLTYRAILEPLGERLVDAHSGADALQRLMEEEFAVILLDVNMPGMDGFETASMIHEHPRFERTPIIFVTAVNVSDLDRMRGYKLGAVDYVTVPVIPEILRSKVVVLGELHRKRLALQQANDQLAAANESLQAEKSRELAALNDSLRLANIELGERNAELQKQVGERLQAEAQLRDQDRRWRTSCATRWRRCAMRWRSAACAAATTRCSR